MSKLLHKLETHNRNETPPTFDVIIVDTMFIVNIMPVVAQTYGRFAMNLLIMLVKMGQCIHLVSDTYRSSSIKDIERDRRADMCGTRTIKITGPDQKMTDFKQAMRSGDFKTSLLQFLAVEWENERYASILGETELFFALDNTCYKFAVSNGQIKKEETQDLQSEHEEADTRIVFHLHYVMRISPSSITNVCVRANDTDIFVNLLYYALHQQEGQYVWMDVGLNSTNNRRYISIQDICKSVDSDFVEALPALHSFTGSDYTAAFYRKGKIRPYNIMEKTPKYAQALALLGHDEEIRETVTTTIEEFVCELYGERKSASVNETRYAIFQNLYAPKKKNEPLEKIRGAHASIMPPCKTVLANKIKRANYVAALCKHAHKANPCFWDL